MPYFLVHRSFHVTPNYILELFTLSKYYISMEKSVGWCCLDFRYDFSPFFSFSSLKNKNYCCTLDSMSYIACFTSRHECMVLHAMHTVHACPACLHAIKSRSDCMNESAFVAFFPLPKK